MNELLGVGGEVGGEEDLPLRHNFFLEIFSIDL